MGLEVQFLFQSKGLGFVRLKKLKRSQRSLVHVKKHIFFHFTRQTAYGTSRFFTLSSSVSRDSSFNKSRMSQGLCFYFKSNYPIFAASPNMYIRSPLLFRAALEVVAISGTTLPTCFQSECCYKRLQSVENTDANMLKPQYAWT